MGVWDDERYTCVCADAVEGCGLEDGSGIEGVRGNPRIVLLI